MKTAASLLVLTGLVAAGDARADWPMSRHDARRTGATNGKSDILKPKVAWSAYLGGFLGAASMLVHDVDGDGKGDVLYINGGVVSAKRADDALIWSTRILAAGSLRGIVDLDGDGKPELIVSTQVGAWVIDLATGAPLWVQPAGEMGWVSNLRVADVTGDGRLDVIVTECGGCGTGKVQTGFVYSFPAGFSAAHRTELGPIQGAGPVFTVIKVDPSAPARLITNQDSSTLALLDGITGKTITLSPSVGAPLAWSTICLPGDIDGIPGEELVCVASDADAPAPVAGDVRKVFALKYTGSPSPALDLLWVYNAPAGEAISNDFDDPIVDLDGDGIPETIASAYLANGTFTTHILSARTGASITTIDGERFVGVAHLESPTAWTILTFADNHTSAWSYDGVAKQVVKRWQIEDHYPVPEPDPSRPLVGGAAGVRPVAVDLNGDGLLDLIMVKLSPGAQIDGYVTPPAPAVVVKYASFVLPPGVAGGAVWSVSPGNLGGPQVATGESDGTLRFLDHQLQPTPAAVRFGGFYADGGWEKLGTGAVAASVGSAAQAIFATNSLGQVVHLDASKATPGVPPVEVWRAPNASSPIIVPGLLGSKPGVVALVRDPETSPEVTSVVAMDPDNGSVVWSTPIPALAVNDLLSGSFDLDGTPDIAVQWSSSGSTTLTTAGLSGATGKQLWHVDAVAAGCALQSAGYSLDDWNGDGIDDVIQVRDEVLIASGKDGAPIAQSPASFCYFLPTPLDIDKDGVEELLVHGGFAPVTVLTHDVQTTLYQSMDDDHPYPYGAVATCAAGPVLVEGSWLHPARLKLTQLTTGAATTMVLASGKTYPDEAAAAADKAGFGQLTSSSIHADLQGNGRPVATVGSQDGFLYALDPCTGDLVFTHDFGFAVGDIIFGDSDGDGLDEILVSVADGNLYALKNDDGTVGTGGSGGMGGMGVSGSSSVTTGAGGAGGGTSSSSGVGGEGGAPSTSTGDDNPLYGRAGCYCATPSGPADGGPALLALASALAVTLRRSRRRG